MEAWVAIVKVDKFQASAQEYLIRQFCLVPWDKRPRKSEKGVTNDPSGIPTYLQPLTLNICLVGLARLSHETYPRIGRRT